MTEKTTATIHQPSVGQPVRITFVKTLTSRAGRFDIPTEERTIVLSQAEWTALKENLSGTVYNPVPGPGPQDKPQSVIYAERAATHAQKAADAIGATMSGNHANLAVAYSNLAFVAERQERKKS